MRRFVSVLALAVATLMGLPAPAHALEQVDAVLIGTITFDFDQCLPIICPAQSGSWTLEGQGVGTSAATGTKGSDAGPAVLDAQGDVQGWILFPGSYCYHWVTRNGTGTLTIGSKTWNLANLGVAVGAPTLTMTGTILNPSGGSGTLVLEAVVLGGSGCLQPGGETTFSWQGVARATL